MTASPFAISTGAAFPISWPGRAPAADPTSACFDGRTGVPLPGAIGSFFADDPSFASGVFVGCADVNGDSVPDINTGAGAGGGPHVKVFSGVDGSPLPPPNGSFFVFAPAFTGGVSVGP